MLDSRITKKKKRKKKKMEKKGKNPSNSHFVVWNSRQGGKVYGLMQKLRKFVYRLIRGRWNIQEGSEKDKVRKFYFLRTTGTKRYQRQFAVSFFRQNISSLCFLWVKRWPLMNNDVRRDFISWMLAFGIIRISIVLIQDVLIWKLLFRLGKLNVDFKKKTIIDSNFINIVEVCNNSKIREIMKWN